MIFRIRIKVTTKAKKNELTKEPNGSWKVRVTCAPTKGEANERVIELIAEEFKTAKSNVSIVHGLRGKEKVVEIQM